MADIDGAVYLQALCSCLVASQKRRRHSIWTPSTSMHHRESSPGVCRSATAVPCRRRWSRHGRAKRRTLVRHRRNSSRDQWSVTWLAVWLCYCAPGGQWVIAMSECVLTVCLRCELWWAAGMVICLERGADLHMTQLMPLPLAVSCFSKIQIGYTFPLPAHPDSRGPKGR